MKFTLIGSLFILVLTNTASIGVVAANNDEASLRLLQQYAELEDRLHANQFGQPVVLDSTEAGSLVTGEIHAVVEHPFAEVRTALDNPDHWCDVLSLHINTKYCRAMAGPEQTVLKVNVGKKTPQRLEDAARIEFIYTRAAATPEYLNIKLDAEEGAMGASNFHIEFEAVPLQDGNTFLHFTYAYSISGATQFGLKAYLSTLGRSKEGFTIVGTTRSGQPEYIGGVRGIMERNTMRYYLAIDSFFAAGDGEPAQQLDQRLQSWFAATEKYPQLHELELDEYLAMKQAEYLRQQTAD
ncbi:MAG: hypothetical protein V4603_00635 [Pseudomonadota bacterium]